jgi:hypothetical protein
MAVLTGSLPALHAPKYKVIYWAHIAGRLNPDLNPEARTKPPQFI